jgi:hypothetical protein
MVLQFLKLGDYLFFMDGIAKYIDSSFLLKEILETYLQLRLHFQKLGFSEEDLENPPTYTTVMINGFEKIGNLNKRLKSDVNDFFGGIDDSEYTTYIMDRFKKINELTPLSKDGYNKGRN